MTSILGPLLFTSFAVHYGKISIHLRQSSVNKTNIHSFARRDSHIGIPYMTPREHTIIQGTQVPTQSWKKLPAYSPFLNIVEQEISVLKAAMKTDISRPEVQARMGNRDEAIARGIPLGEFRTQLLLEALQRSIGTITPVKCTQWCRLMQTYLPRCMNREVIEG